MSLATRCSACGTVFRVVQDQLRVSGGWVRCGRCAEVFNAIESLVDLELDRPIEEADPGPHGARVMHDLAQFTGPIPWVAPAPAPAEVPAATEVAAAASAASGTTPKAPPQVPDAETPRSATAQEGSPEDLAQAPLAEVRGEVDEPATHDLRGEPIALATPAFLRKAERAAQWRRPGVRATLAVLVVFGAMALSAQAMLAWHDLAAARWPTLAPAIARLCEWQGCRIGPPRRIESLAVESSGLRRTGAPGTYLLALVIRNRESSIALRLPSVDLTLTDALGQTMARRIIEPAALGAARESIVPGAELQLAAHLLIGAGPVAGYTIELFYP